MRTPFSWRLPNLPFFRTTGNGQDITKTSPRRPGALDMSGGLPANADMLTGLYHGSYPGLELASALALNPILKPVDMIGLPTPRSSDPLTQQRLNEILADQAPRLPQLHRAILLLGTGWRWPKYDAKSDQLLWEVIPDASITEILMDLDTGIPAAILTHEQIKMAIKENETAYYERKRRFDRNKVKTNWIGQKPAELINSTFINVSGELPVSFPNDTDEGEYSRGHSVLSRIVRDLKNYHDIDYMRVETLAKFRAKQIQSTSDPDEWLAQNHISSDLFSTFDFAGNDFVLNLSKEETTDYLFLTEGATKPYTEALSSLEMKIVKGSGVPELFWGQLATGNHATTQEQREDAVSYVTNLRAQWVRPYYRMFDASLRLLSIARMEKYKPFEMRWNGLDSLSQETKAQIFLRFAQAFSQFASSSLMTKQQGYDMWKANYPELPLEDYITWEKGIEDMAKFQKNRTDVKIPDDQNLDKEKDKL